MPDHYDRLSRSISLFCSALAITLAAEYLYLRPTDAHPAFLIVSLALLLINLPSGIRLLRREAWYLSEAAVVLAGLLLLVLLGLIAGVVGIALALPFAVIGWALLIVTITQSYMHKQVIRDITLITLAIVFGLWLAGNEWGWGYHDPYFVQRAALGTSHIDTAYNAAVAAMIKTYGFPSTGLDGLVYLYYWYSSHFIFAQFANLTGLPTLAFYLIGFPVMIMPLFFYGLLTFGMTVQQRFWPHSWNRLAMFLFWGLLPVVAIGFIHHQIAGAAALWPSFLFSESYTTSLTITFLSLALLLRGWGDAKSQRIVLILAPVLLGVIGFTKGSVMLILYALTLYFFVRLGWYKQKLMVGAMVAATVIVFSTYRAISFADSSYMHLDPFSFPNNYVAIGWQWLWYIFAFIWSYLYVTLKLVVNGIRTPRDVIEAVRKRTILDVEFVLVTAVVSAAPALTFFVPDGSVIYFWDFQRWVAVGMLLANIPALTARLSPQRTVLVGLVALAMAPSLVTNYSVGLGQDRRVAESLSTPPPRNSEMIALLQELESLPAEVKRETLLFIPQTNYAYWGVHEFCRANPFIAPAISGLAMLDGVPELGCDVVSSGYMGYRDYITRTEPQSLRADDREGLCEAAQARGFSRIIVIESLTRVDIDCMGQSH